MLRSLPISQQVPNTWAVFQHPFRTQAVRLQGFIDSADWNAACLS